MKKILASICAKVARAEAYLESENGRRQLAAAKRALPALAFLALGFLGATDALASGATTTSIGTEINKGFKSIYEIGKLALGGVALCMALWKIYQWYGGDQNAPKQLGMIGVISIIGLNLDSILKLFGLTI